MRPAGNRCPDHLLARSRRGPLSLVERRALQAHAAVCELCRAALALGALHDAIPDSPRPGDDALVARLARDRMPLTVCPLSNQRLQVVPDLKLHPLRHMMDKGLMVTVNSDDPAYFGGYVNDNYRAVQQSLGLSRDDIVALARNGFIASMMPEAERQQALVDFDRAVAEGA